MENASIIILGGNGAIGSYLAAHLDAMGMEATFVRRRSSVVPKNFGELLIDLNSDGIWNASPNSTVISLLPLWVFIRFLPRLTGAKAVIATSSTSRFSKSESTDVYERSVAEKLTNAENTLQDWAETHKISWTVLRPTLIYDCRTDKNITRMAGFIRRWHFLPIAIPAGGLRQPIHTDDVAKAVAQSINNPAAANKAFNISGGEVLSYRAMAERVFDALGKSPCFLWLPVSFLQMVFRMASSLGILKESSFGAAVFQRMNENLVFETAEGLAALNYQPRRFEPDFSNQ